MFKNSRIFIKVLDRGRLNGITNINRSFRLSSKWFNRTGILWLNSKELNLLLARKELWELALLSNKVAWEWIVLACNLLSEKENFSRLALMRLDLPIY